MASCSVGSTRRWLLLKMNTHQTWLGCEAVRRPSSKRKVPRSRASLVPGALAFLAPLALLLCALNAPCAQCSVHGSRPTAGARRHALLHCSGMWSCICISAFRSWRCLRRPAPDCLGLFLFFVFYPYSYYQLNVCKFKTFFSSPVTHTLWNMVCNYVLPWFSQCLSIPITFV